MESGFSILDDCLELLYWITPYFNEESETLEQWFDHREIIDSLIATNKDDDFVVRLALLLQFIDNPKEVLSNIRMDNRTSKSILDLLNHLDDYKHISIENAERKYEARRLINEIGFENLKKLCDLWQAKIMVASPINKFKFLKIAKQVKIDAEIITENNECCTLDKLDISGDDLIAIGYEPSKEIGNVLHMLLEQVMRDPYKNKNKWLVTWAKKLKNNQEIIQDSN